MLVYETFIDFYSLFKPDFRKKSLYRLVSENIDPFENTEIHFWPF